MPSIVPTVPGDPEASVAPVAAAAPTLPSARLASPVEALFDRQAEDYDAWYDTRAGGVVLAEEVDALRPLIAGTDAPRLEVGAGGGRFATALGVGVGLDPARAALSIALRRRVRVAQGRGEALPFADATFGAVLLVVTLCFVADPLATLREARRVVRSHGRVVLGIVPADGPWGRHYQALAAAGHPYYATARFFTRSELTALLRAAGLMPVRMRASLLWPPQAPPAAPAAAHEGDLAGAGFLAIAAVPRRDAR